MKIKRFRFPTKNRACDYCGREVSHPNQECCGEVHNSVAYECSTFGDIKFSDELTTLDVICIDREDAIERAEEYFEGEPF